MAKARKKCWSHSLGVYGSRVRVAELQPGGRLYLLWLDGRGKQQKRSLGHADRRRGKEEGLAFANGLATDRESIETRKVTLSMLFDIYKREGLHGRTEKHSNEVHRKLGRWTLFLGKDKQVESLNPADVERFVHARRSGTLQGEDSALIPPVEMTTIWHDFVALNTALNFATRHRDVRGKPLMVRNPLHGVRVGKTVTPARPVADAGYYHAIREAGRQLPPTFVLAVDLAYSTGHRIDAVLKLRWVDISFDSTDTAPSGSIRWRGENDKIDNDHTVPMNQLAVEALSSARDDNGGPSEWVFPSPRDFRNPLDRHLASRWLRRAERIAGVAHVKGKGWHSFRRGWASHRKHLPDVDVAAAGGWKDTTIMKRCYQHADAKGVLRAVTLA